MAAPDPGFLITLDAMLKIWQLIGAPAVAIVFYYVRGNSRLLREMNGRLIKLETRVEVNEDKTEREFDQIQRRCEMALKSHTPSHGGIGTE